MRRYLFLIGILLIVLSACKKTPVITPTALDVYVSGYQVSASGLNAATYWKNGVPVTLASPSLYSNAQAISVQGNTVYVAGYDMAGNGIPIATLWKNNVATRLADTLTNSVANGMFVNGSDVYVVGDILGADGYWTPHYWKNGVDVALPLTGGKAYVSARCIFVSGQDVYVGGQASPDNSSEDAVYWKNGVETFLTQHTAVASAEAIAVADNNIYLAGYVNNTGASTAVYWKNGTMTTISAPGVASAASGLNVTGDNIFIAGVEENLQVASNPQHLIYWKNDAGTIPAIDFDQNVAADHTGGITTFNTDVYVAGMTGGKSACYWKNGTCVTLGDGVGHGIAVVAH